MRGSHYLFYDGTCGTCHRFIRFILRFKGREAFLFYPLTVFPEHYSNSVDSVGRPLTGDSVLLVRNGETLQRSAAVLAILSELGFPWNLLGVFHLVPRFLRDAAYDIFAKHRFRIFGRVAPESLCPLAAPEIRKLFPAKMSDKPSSSG